MIKKEDQEYYADMGFDKAVEYSDFDNDDDLNSEMSSDKKKVRNDNDEIEDYFNKKNSKQDIHSIDDKSVGSKVVRPMSAKYKTADQKN